MNFFCRWQSATRIPHRRARQCPDKITTASLNGWYFAVAIQSALLWEHHAHLCEYLCESIG
jgi:hypothetical protein